MALTNEFKEAVANKKFVLIRIMMKDSFLIDPSATLFDEMAAYLRQNEIAIYDVHDGETLNYNTGSWTKDYMNSQMVNVVNNFSEERIQLLKCMVRYLYKDRGIEEKETTIGCPEGNTSEKNQDKNIEQTVFSKKQIGMGICVLGAGVTMVGICTGLYFSKLTVAACITIVGGIVLMGMGTAIIKSSK